MMIGCTQNLVNNPSFEEYFSCPKYENELSLSKHWFNLHDGTPDYFNKCTKKAMDSKVMYFGVPVNLNGYQGAKTGQAYVGVINFAEKDFTYREFIATQLQKPLESNRTYRFGMYVSLSDSSKYYNNRFGFCFSSENKLPSEWKINEYNVYLCNNSVVIVNDSIGKDTASWHLVQGEYLAKGGEEYLIIGLCKNNITKKQYKYIKRKCRTGLGGWDNRLPYAYYYIDDVFVE